MKQEIKERKFASYRSEINKILNRNRGNIQITKVLKDLHISKGNYYVFMNGGKKYKSGNVSTLSFKKLDMLLAELKAIDSASTNKEVINAMTEEQLAKLIKTNFIDNPRASQIDIKKWLKSTKPQIIYKDVK